MKFLDKILDRKPRNLDDDDQFTDDENVNEGEIDDDIGAAADAAAVNDDVQRKQMMLFGAIAAVVAIGGSYYVFSGDDEAKSLAAKGAGVTTEISTDDMLNRNLSEREWMGQSEAQISAQGQNIKALDNRVNEIEQLRGQLAQSNAEKASMTSDGQRVMAAYESENSQLKAALQAAQQSRVAPQAFAGPQRMYGTQAAGTYRPAAVGNQAAASSSLPSAPILANEVKLVSFGDGKSAGNASPVDRGNTVYSDSASYLPPNSIAPAKIIVGVDASAGVNSQSDPLPVVLRITGPARSVYDRGKLLTTNIAGCLVNGAARGDLSSEKVYVKLQRMTCPQPNGRFAVSEVKGFIAFGGKTGVRGRVVSREGALVGQAFLAGLAGGFGRGFGANSNSLLSGTNISVDGRREELSTGDILKGGFGEGVAQSGDMVSKYLIERAEQYQPVIEIPTGIDVEIVFLDGVFVSN